MPGFNPERINIKDLTIEEPEKSVELHFDIEKDLTEEHWVAMSDELEYRRTEGLEENNWRNFLEQAAVMKVLDPDVELNTTEHEWQQIEKALEELKRKGIKEGKIDNEEQQWQVFALAAMRFKIINPKANIHLDELAWQGMEKELIDVRATHETDEFSEHLIAMKVLDPKRQLDITLDDYETMKDSMESWRENGINDYEKNFFGFSRIAARLKILDSTKVQLNEDDWIRMKEYLNLETNQWSFSNQAMFMKILAAQKVEITEKGLEVTMQEKESSLSEVLEMPEKRNF